MTAPTKSQKRLIQEMEMQLGIEFHGWTLVDASRFISHHIESYQEAQMFAFEKIYNEMN